MSTHQGLPLLIEILAIGEAPFLILLACGVLVFSVFHVAWAYAFASVAANETRRKVLLMFELLPMLLLLVAVFLGTSRTTGPSEEAPLFKLVGWVFLVLFAFSLVVRFFLPPLARNKALRNAFLVHALPTLLLALAFFLAASEQTERYGFLVLFLAIAARRFLVWPFVRKRLREASREQQPNQA